MSGNTPFNDVCNNAFLLDIMMTRMLPFVKPDGHYA